MTAGAVNLEGIVSDIFKGSDTDLDNLTNLASTMDVTSPDDMVQMQMAMTKVTMSYQLESALVKSIEDMLKSIVQRM